MISYIPGPSASSPVNALQGNWAYGNGNPGTVTTITYNFARAINSEAWTAGYKNDFRKALAAIEAVANIKFIETSNAASADLVEYIAPSSVIGRPTTLGFHYGPSNAPSTGAFSTDYWKPGVNGDPGGYFFTTILHELGHALGLGHPHDTGFGTAVMAGVTSPFNVFGVNNLNQGVYTIMSYNDGWTQANGNLPVSNSYGGSTGLGALDIAALQAMYGANTSYQSGSTTYSLAGSNTAGTGYQAIWDTGGTDTIRYDGSVTAVIDLRPATLDYTATGGGVVSYVAGVQGGFTIAHGVVIENATGGSGSDIIVGNTTQNVLRGNGGHDTITSVSNGSNNNTIYGGSGNDTIYLAYGSGADQVFGDQGNDLAVVAANAGSFSGGTGTDTVRFVTAISNYLFLTNGATYQFLNVVTRITFTISNDVELIQFLNGAQQYSWSNIGFAMQLSDVDTTGTTLQQGNQGIYVLDAGSSNIALSLNGQVMGQYSLAGWQAIQAEAISGGFKVLWKNADGTYAEWTLNGAGQFVSGTTVANVSDVEVFYGADINGDGLTGHGTFNVETSGSTTLAVSTQTGYLVDGNQVTLSGTNMGPNSLSGWQAIQAEAIAGEFKLLWKNADGTYAEWTLDGSGNFVSGATVANVIDVEAFYGVDLNNDGTIGVAPPKLSQFSPSLQKTAPAVGVLEETDDVFEFPSNLLADAGAENAVVMIELELAAADASTKMIDTSLDSNLGHEADEETALMISSSMEEDVFLF